MELDQIKEVIALLEASKLRKLVYKKGDFELQLEKEAEPMAMPSFSVPRMVVGENQTESAFQAELSMKGERGGGRRVEAEGKYVTSPMVGTYYTCPGPDQPPFVKVGDTVTEHTVVCIIEAMKVMNEVKAGTSGVVAEILSDNGQPVEFGTPLLRIT